MSEAPKMAEPIFESLVNAIEAENPGRNVSVVTILIEEGAPPTLYSNFHPDELPFVFAWLIQNHSDAGTHDWKPTGQKG